MHRLVLSILEVNEDFYTVEGPTIPSSQLVRLLRKLRVSTIPARLLERSTRWHPGTQCPHGILTRIVHQRV